MPPDSVWSDQFKKSEIQLNLTGTGWKNLMSNCLSQTDICKKNENKSCVNFDPNIIMDTRHKMVKEVSKVFPTPREQTQSEAFKLLREEYHDRLLRHKEGKLVETEIRKLRQILENHRFVIKEKLERTNQRVRAPPIRTRFINPYRRTPKGLESCDALRRMDAWLGCSHEMTVETKSSRQESQAEKIAPSVAARKGSLIDGKEENDFWEEDEGKDEIMRKFFENSADVKEEVQGEQGKDVHDGVHRKSVGCALKKWKNCENECENGKTVSKIEKFLSRLKEKKVKEKKRTVPKADGEIRRKALGKRGNDEETEEKLKKLMEEVKSSQKEAHQKLQEAKVSIKTESKFLLRMEERRKERMKRRRAFEERKLKLEEEKESMQRQRGEEKKLKEEQEKRQRLEELREKRRAEKEKKKEDEREREKMKANAGLAAAHYKVHLLRGYGLRPWVRLMRQRECQQQQAVTFFERKLKERTLRAWVARVREQTELKVRCAEAFYEGMLKRNCLAMWMELYRERLRQDQVAVDWYDLKRMETSFRRWLQFTKEERWEYQIQRELAIRHHQRKVKVKYLKKLRDYPIVKRLEEAKENRKWKWRQKVREILPDYEPAHISENF